MDTATHEPSATRSDSLEAARANHPGPRQSDPPTLTLADLRSRATVTVEQAGSVLGLSRGGAFAAAQRGDLPVIRIGRRLIVSTQALLRMLDADRESA